MDKIIIDRIKEHNEAIVHHQNMIRVLRNEQIRWNPMIDNILQQISVDYWVWVEEILWKWSWKQLMAPRRKFVRIMRDEYLYTFKMIWDLLWREHSSILYLYKYERWGRKKKK